MIAPACARVCASPWPDTRLADLLGIATRSSRRHEGPSRRRSPPRSERRRLGSLPCGGLAPGDRDALDALRRLTNRAVSLNFFAHPAAAADADGLARARARLAPFYAEKGLGAPAERLDPAPAGFATITSRSCSPTRPRS